MTYAISTAGLELVMEFEGFRAEPAPLPDGNWVVGYSHVRVGQGGAAVTRKEAVDLLSLDLAPVERVVNALVTQPLTQSQFDALVSFAFSIGLEAFAQSQVLRRVNSNDFVAAACAMDAWRKIEVNGELEIADALVRRRAAEKALFLKETFIEAAPSVMLRAKLDHAASILGAPVKAATMSARQPLNQPASVASNVVAFATVASAEEQPIIVQAPVFEPALRLTEILKSEPQTEALLLTQVVANDVDAEEESEIVTAHAKPVARTLDAVREATRKAHAEQQNKRKPFFSFAKREPKEEIVAVKPELKVDRRIRTMRRAAEARQTGGAAVSHSVEQFGLAALLTFGLGLIALGGSLLFNGTGDAVDIFAAIGVVTPGVIATLMAAYGFRRSPRRAAV
ncbi:MAG TPA: lysozyme [Vitreimonas sp.]|uniref:lysozyme n=1 Tax=Vitreimonas sp. TaxID=3069702 RepID=UPI002D329519|nr:lysozyme [Vitreimonas sp.]HYD87961.1 lysozyme [Vitreimonas sp.]